MSFGKVWNLWMIFRKKKLHNKPCRPHLTNITRQNMVSRMAACVIWLKQEEDWFERAEWWKRSILQQVPNKKNGIQWYGQLSLPWKKNAGSRIARHTTSPTRFPISCSLSSETDWSCRTENHWPSDSPDLSCLDFSFWQRAADDFVRLKP